MTGAIAPVAALLASVAILLTGNSLQSTLLPVRAGIEHFTTLSIGAMGSAYFLGFAIGCVVGPLLVRRVGHIRTYAAMAAIASAVPLLHLLWLTPLSWSTMRAVNGFCFAALFVVIESWLNERSTNENRGLVLSVYVIINMTVNSVGQILLTLEDPGSFQLFALVSVLVSIAAVPVALTAAAAPAPIRAVRIQPLELYRISPLGFAGCLAIGMANGSWWSLAPVFAKGSGLDVNGIAIFASATVLGAAAGQWPIGRISDRIDRRLVLIAGSVVSAGLGAVLLFSPGAERWLLFALSAAWGMSAFTLYAVAVAHTNDFARPDQCVVVSSGLLLLYACGAIVGPGIASALMSEFGVGMLFGFSAMVHGLLAVFAVWRMTRRHQAAPEEQIPFVESLQSAKTFSPVFESDEGVGDGTIAGESTAEAEGIA